MLVRAARTTTFAASRTWRWRRSPAVPGVAEAAFAGAGTAERITAYLRRERDVLRGCPVGRLTQDPDVMADLELRRPVHETFAWLTDRMAGLLEEGRSAGELDESLHPVATATALAAVVQGGYVLARRRCSGGRSRARWDWWPAGTPMRAVSPVTSPPG